MLLNPKAVKRLKRVTESMGYWYNPNETHAQRNELARMFIEEAGRLLRVTVSKREKPTLTGGSPFHLEVRLRSKLNHFREPKPSATLSVGYRR